MTTISYLSGSFFLYSNLFYKKQVKSKCAPYIHKNEDTDNKKTESGGFKREINKRQYNLRGDKNTTVTTTNTTITTEKYGTTNVGKPVYASRRRQGKEIFK